MSILRGKKYHDLPKHVYKKILRLYFHQPWLSTRETELSSLFKLCDNSKEEDLVCDLLENFTYLYATRLESILANLADTITSEIGYPYETSQIVASTFDDNPDSGQMLLEFLKPLLPNFGWPAPKYANQVGRAVRNVDDFPHIILVDEFSGTGKSLIDRVTWLKKQIESKASQQGRKIDFDISVALLVSMRDAFEKISDEGISISAELTLDAGISDRYDPALIPTKIAEMERLESCLKQDVNGRPFPSRGYGAAEALYSRENGNTPNSVFPIFWWRYLADGSEMHPVLDRGDPEYI